MQPGPQQVLVWGEAGHLPEGAQEMERTQSRIAGEGRERQRCLRLALDATQAWILWIREDASGQSLWLSRRTPDLEREYQRLEVAKLQGRGRGTGFPKIALRDGDAYVVWTDIADGAPRLHGVVIGS